MAYCPYGVQTLDWVSYKAQATVPYSMDTESAAASAERQDSRPPETLFLRGVQDELVVD